MRVDARLCSRDGFTLIEMLVVISIITLLLSMTQPALRAAREHSRTAACASNLRQIAVASTSFATEHDDTLPYNDQSLWVAAAGGNNYWDAKHPAFINNYFARTMKYLSAAEVWDCASTVPVASVEWQPGCPGPPIAMMANLYTIGVDPAGPEHRPKRIGALPSPSKASLYLDWGWKCHSVWTSRAFPGFITPFPQPGRIHNGTGSSGAGGVNVVFADTHARFYGGPDFDQGPGFYTDYPLDRWWKHGAIGGAPAP